MAKPQDSTSDEGVQITAAVSSSPGDGSDADVRLVITNSTPRRIVMHHPSAPDSKGRIIVHQRLPSGKVESWRLNACPGDLIIDCEEPVAISIAPGRSLRLSEALFPGQHTDVGMHHMPPGRYTVTLEWPWAKGRVWKSPPLSFRLRL
jgi:hypothetical protein